MEIVTDEGKKVDDPAVLASFMNSFFKKKVSKLQEWVVTGFQLLS